MTTLNQEIEKHINKLIYPLKETEELLVALKLKLTKKELKLLISWSNSEDIESTKSRLNLDEDRYSKLSLQLIKKLNQEKTKQAICA